VKVFVDSQDLAIRHNGVDFLLRKRRADS
jgi:hemin uptake protein HemP